MEVILKFLPEIILGIVFVTGLVILTISNKKGFFKASKNGFEFSQCEKLTTDKLEGISLLSTKKEEVFYNLKKLKDKENRKERLMQIARFNMREMLKVMSDTFQEVFNLSNADAFYKYYEMILIMIRSYVLEAISEQIDNNHFLENAITTATWREFVNKRREIGWAESQKAISVYYDNSLFKPRTELLKTLKDKYMKIYDNATTKLFDELLESEKNTEKKIISLTQEHKELEIQLNNKIILLSS